jgi:hypothetical protein
MRALKHWQVITSMGSDDVQMLRVTDHQGRCIVALCLTPRNREKLVLGSLEAFDDCRNVPSVVCDCTSLVQVTDCDTLMAMSAWLMSAATWLRRQQATGTEDSR